VEAELTLSPARPIIRDAYKLEDSLVGATGPHLRSGLGYMVAGAVADADSFLDPFRKRVSGLQ